MASASFDWIIWYLSPFFGFTKLGNISQISIPSGFIYRTSSTTNGIENYLIFSIILQDWGIILLL